jgi:tRNA-2-methylthio-N6-dimethylallyladenosine synthase
MDDQFLEEFASNPKICKQIHVPLQSGSSKVLKEMKRGYTQENFLNRCKKIRELVPEVTISTDIIVGFPTESDEDFLESMKVLEEVRFDQLFSFKYSPRPHTEAIDFENKVTPELAGERLTILQKRHTEILDEIMQLQLGKEEFVYFDELKTGNRISGRSDGGRLVYIDGSEELLGQIKKVKITKISRASLDGILI